MAAVVTQTLSSAYLEQPGMFWTAPSLLFLRQLWWFPGCSFLTSLKTAAHPILFLMSAVNLQNMLCLTY